MTGRAPPERENSHGCMLISWISAPPLLPPVVIDVGVAADDDHADDTAGGVAGVLAGRTTERGGCCCCCCTLVDVADASRGCVHDEPGARWCSEGGATVDGLSVRGCQATSFLARTEPPSTIADGLEKLTTASCGRGTTKVGAETANTAVAAAAAPPAPAPAPQQQSRTQQHQDKKHRHHNSSREHSSTWTRSTSTTTAPPAPALSNA